ncbi:MAG: hypothetical protein HC778_02715 [Chamaesiphon sp. CSU_1_12]|nr:hypothetical protein [Chamaesiphon sp. CSU_1_12]
MPSIRKYKSNGDAFSWNVDRELITTARPLTILHQQEAAIFNANGLPP